jgi:hypothetical protein
MQSPIEHLSPRHVALGKALCLATMLLVSAVSAIGCGNSLYVLRVNAASVRLEEARTAGAEQSAPYEYTLAKEHLDKAMSEAAEADYGDAYNLANDAADYADQAIERCAQVAAKASAPAAKEIAQ